MAVDARYSEGCTISEKWLATAGTREENRVKVQGVMEMPAGEYDVIVADPPYGFNTNDGLADLAALYVSGIATMVKALRPLGQLVICLPQLSKSGRRVPYFTQREVVTQQALIAAQSQGRGLMVAGFAAPKTGTLFRPPYYWESARALRRSILHFQFT